MSLFDYGRIAFERLSDAPPAICAEVVRDAIRKACAATGTGCMFAL